MRQFKTSSNHSPDLNVAMKVWATNADLQFVQKQMMSIVHLDLTVNNARWKEIILITDRGTWKDNPFKKKIQQP